MNVNRIVTRYVVDGKGKGKVRALAAGKQRTLAYDHSKSPAANHGAAAGVIANEVLGWKSTDNLRHTDTGKGEHVFERDLSQTQMSALLTRAGMTGGE